MQKMQDNEEIGTAISNYGEWDHTTMWSKLKPQIERILIGFRAEIENEHCCSDGSGEKDICNICQSFDLKVFGYWAEIMPIRVNISQPATKIVTNFYLCKPCIDKIEQNSKCELTDRIEILATARFAEGGGY